MSSSSSLPPAHKRQRRVHDGDNDDDDNDTTSNRAASNKDDKEEEEAALLQLLNGDDFVSSEQRQEDAAAQRRAARRKRLQQQQQSSQHPDNAVAAKTNGTASQPSRNRKDEGNNNGDKKKKKISNATAASLMSSKPTAESSITKNMKVSSSSSSLAAAASRSSTSDDMIVENGQQKDKKKSDDDDDDDDFDMFSSSVSPPPAVDANTRVATDSDVQPAAAAAAAAKQQQRRGHEQQDWDDAEGYYKAVIGETIELKIQNNNHNNNAAAAASDSTFASTTTSSSPQVLLRVLGVVGKGVFSTVLKCTTISNSSSMALPPTVALKCIRHNETMTKAAQAEIRILQQLESSPGIVPLLLPHNKSNHGNTNHATSNYLEHCGHLLLVFPFMEYNLRDVLQKFGKGVGLSLQAVRSYAGQLLAAATHLKKHHLIHADLKPDNILVSGDFSTVQLADFGSVMESSNSTNQSTTTPYLVSRFYRAPEIILGLSPLTVAVDLWSLAVTVAEVFLGRVLFRGQSNNDMLYVFMQHLGPFSNRVIRQHLVACQKHGHAVVQRHFQQEATNYVFLQQTQDAVTGEAVHKVLPLQQSTTASSSNNTNKFPSATPLRQKILHAKSAKDSAMLVTQFADLLQKALALDPTRRISLKDALQHEFFQDSSSS